MRNGIPLEMTIEGVITSSGEAQQGVWKQAHLVCRYDRQYGYVVGFTAPALDTLVQYVAANAIFGNIAERDHYTASLRWRMTQGVTYVIDDAQCEDHRNHVQHKGVFTHVPRV